MQLLACPLLRQERQAALPVGAFERSHDLHGVHAVGFAGEQHVDAPGDYLRTQVPGGVGAVECEPGPREGGAEAC